MSAKRIKNLINEFDIAHEENEYACFIISNKDLSIEEKEEWEVEADLSEQEIHNIARQIKELKPSKYMMEKYTELEYILSYA